MPLAQSRPLQQSSWLQSPLNERVNRAYASITATGRA